MTSLFQFSIRGLLAAVAVVAVGFAALLNANDWWEASLWGLVLLLLGGAVMLAVYRQREQSAYWLGFSLAGGLYLALLLFSWIPNLSNACPLQLNSLVTTRLTQAAYFKLLPESRRTNLIYLTTPVPDMPDMATGAPSMGMGAKAPWTPVEFGRPRSGPGMPGMPGVGMPGPAGFPMATSPNPNYISLGNFLNIGHALWLLLSAAVGGKFGQFIYRTRPQET